MLLLSVTACTSTFIVVLAALPATPETIAPVLSTSYSVTDIPNEILVALSLGGVSFIASNSAIVMVMVGVPGLLMTLASLNKILIV